MEILGGEPVIAGTRVPVRNLIDYLEHRSSLDDFLADFPSVTGEQAVSVLEMAREAAGREAPTPSESESPRIRRLLEYA